MSVVIKPYTAKEKIKDGLFWLAVGIAFLMFSQIDSLIGVAQ